jgi:hypothetical protein
MAGLVLRAARLGFSMAGATMRAAAATVAAGDGDGDGDGDEEGRAKDEVLGNGKRAMRPPLPLCVAC